MLEKGRAIIIGSMAAGSVRCFAAMTNAGKVYVDRSETRLPLRHSHHRYTIDGPNGAQRLTIALQSATHLMHTPMHAVRISEHGNWRHLHWGALYSAYGKSPYFDYIAPELHAIIHGGQTSLLDFNTQLQTLIIDFLDLPIEVVTTDITPEIAAEAIDLRGKIGGKRPDTLPIATVPYHQMWAARHGFLPNLSTPDPLLNPRRATVRPPLTL